MLSLHALWPTSSISFLPESWKHHFLLLFFPKVRLSKILLLFISIQYCLSVSQVWLHLCMLLLNCASVVSTGLCNPEMAAHQRSPSLGFAEQNTGWGGIPSHCTWEQKEVSESAQSCLTPSLTMDCSYPGILRPRQSTGRVAIALLHSALAPSPKFIHMMPNYKFPVLQLILQ